MTTSAKRKPERSTSVAADESLPAEPKQKPQEGMRETVEAVAIAFILAFVFKTFEAEAFVIPTGSMAPTLYGRHKEVHCEGCSLKYTVGASQEVDQLSGILLSGHRLQTSLCPNCRRLNDIEHASVFNGDRIVVNKQVARFERFNVVVFKNPEEPSVNFIKRLVGLPGETIRFRQGDVYARREGESEFRIQRKEDVAVQDDIQILVYDDQFPPLPLLKLGAGERWVGASSVPEDTASAGWPQIENAWKRDDAARSYRVDAPDGDWQWLRYRHLVPGTVHWTAADDGTGQLPPLQPQLIGDFCGFNVTSTGSVMRSNSEDAELYWTSDLSLDLQLDLQSATPSGRLAIELEEGLRTVRVVFDLAGGKASIVVMNDDASGQPGPEVVVATADCELTLPEVCDVTVANVDDRVSVLIDGELLDFGAAAELPSFELNVPGTADMAPAGIAASGVQAVVSGLKLRRDIYYRNDVLKFDQRESAQDLSKVRRPTEDDYIYEIPVRDRRSMSASLRDPAVYAREYARLTAKQEAEAGDLRDYRLADDEFLMCGDNSPASQDSRLFNYWNRPLRGVDRPRYAVTRDQLIGEALVIFWPHGIPFMNNGRGYTILNHKKEGEYDERSGTVRIERDPDYPLYVAPFYPNLSRMKVIR
jgi:signal peptidase I